MHTIRKIAVIILLSAVLPFALLSQHTSSAKSDSLLRIRATSEGLDRAIINVKIALSYYPQNLDSVLFYRSLLENFLTEEYDKLIDGYVKKFYGYEAHRRLDIEKAMDYAREALILFGELGDYKEMGWLSLNLARNYFRLGDFASATEQNMQALSYFEQSGYREGIAEVYNELGKISYQSRYFPKAREYFEAALAIYDELGISRQKNKIYNNLGIMLMKDGALEKSLRNLFSAAKGFMERDDLRRVALVYGNIAICYDELDQPDSAMFFSRKALDYSVKAGDEYSMISGMINLGYFLRLRQTYDSSLIYLNHALEISVRKKLKVYEEAAYEEFSDLYADMGDFKNAYTYYQKSDSVQNIISSEKSEQRIEELLFSYRQKIKEKELIQLKADQQMQKRLNYIFILLIVLSFVVVIILTNIYRRKKSQKRLLEEKNLLLEKYNEKLVKSEQALKTMNDEKNRLFSIVAHDLRNPVSAISGFTDLLTEKFDELDDDTRKEYIEQITHGSRRTLSLLENLLLWARSQMDLIEIKKTEISVVKLIEECRDDISCAAEQKNISLKLDIRDEFNLYVDVEMIKAVLRNLISNAIKFSNSGNRVTVTSFRKNGTLCISVSDEGTGFQQDLLKQLFKTGQIVSTKGTANEKGSGLGLLIAKDYTEKNEGGIYVESEPGKGSVFTISFPV